jgi:G3E family GTPase
MSGDEARIPLTIVTGFLGSGKTTLIRHLLADSRFADAAIIVNEFGAVGIDHHLFRKTDERVTLLRDGCACCARRDDLVDALHDLVRCRDRGEEPGFDRVVLETSGLADPAPILHTIVADPVLSRRYRVDHVIATFDAIAGETNLETHDEAVRQLAAATVVVLTKRDLAADEASARLRALARRVNPVATVVLADHGRVDVDHVLRDASTADLDTRLGDGTIEPRPEPHGATGRTVSLDLVFADPLDWRMLGLWLTMLLHRHGARVLRVKGLLDVGGQGPLLLEGVQHVVHAPRHLQAWPDDDRRSRLVFIARDLDPDRIRDSLTVFQEVGRER